MAGMKRIVHLDLKGAPWKVQYLVRVFQSIKEWGGTGILLEWEDTFPYVSELMNIGSLGGSGRDGLYTLEEVKYILQYIKAIGLEPIQLIQTMGHMEFVLKHEEFRRFREEPRSPAALCPARGEAAALVRAVLRQALDVQPDATYLHIGADEVWYIGLCQECKRKAAINPHKTASLFLEHIRSIALFLKEFRPNLKVLMWDDMMRSISVETLSAYQLGENIEPVIWEYSPIETFKVDISLWSKYIKVFPRVWAGSAFKGANGSCQLMSLANRYVSNQEAWLQEFRKYRTDIKFTGIILTGWSRYDHYATLCELLPVALPCLASCLKILIKPENVPKDAVVSDVLPPEQWPGEDLARTIHSFIILRQRSNNFINGDMLTTWMNQWQIAHEFTQPLKVEAIYRGAKELLTQLSALQRPLSTHLHAITGRRSSEEWLQTFFAPLISKLTEISQTAEAKSKCEANAAPRSERKRICD